MVGNKGLQYLSSAFPLFMKSENLLHSLTWHQLLKLKMGAKPTTLSGLSGSGDIMLTCFVNLSRNRSVGLRLGSGEKLDEIMSSMNQVCSILCMTSIYAQYMTCMIQFNKFFCV